MQKLVIDLQSRVKVLESSKGSAAPITSTAKPAAKVEDDDDGVDLFASDSEVSYCDQIIY